MQVAAAPDRVFRGLVDVGSWWSKAHTYTGDATNMSIVAQPGGCFCEELPTGLGVEHGRVVNVVPNRLLRLATALGPLQELGVAGSMTWQIAPSGQGSTLTMTYVVGGYMAGGLDQLADPVDKVLAQQIALLKAHVEKAQNSPPRCHRRLRARCLGARCVATTDRTIRGGWIRTVG